jgi:hypothetical protein
MRSVSTSTRMLRRSLGFWMRLAKPFCSSRLISPVTDAGASPDCLASSPAVSGPERSSRSSAFSSLALSPCLAATAVWNITVATLEARPAMASCWSSSARRSVGDRVPSGAEGVVMPASVAYI